MKKDLLFFALAITILISSGLPYYGKELFVAKTGHIDHMQLMTALLLIAGVRFNWKHIYKIIIWLYSLYLAGILLTAGFTLLDNPVLLKSGYYFLAFDVILVLILTTMLKKIENTTTSNI